MSYSGSAIVTSILSHHAYFYWASFGIICSMLFVTQFVALPVLLQMVAYTGPIIYIGSHMSLEQKAIDPDTGEKQVKTEAMTQNDACLFPVVGSAALLCLYVAYKFLPIYWVNFLLTSYLTLFGCVALGETLYFGLMKICPDSWNRTVVDVKYTLPGKLHDWIGLVEFKASNSRLAGLAVSFILAVCWMVSKHWVLHNVFAIAFCLQGIRLVSVSSFKIACLLLGGLFIYDVFWVFGTDVMVTVAKSFEAPAKLIFPVSINPWKQSILGLGDVVIPGVFIAMALRFDHHLHEKAVSTCKQPLTTSETFDIHQHFDKFYFYCNIAAYELGLMLTGVVMLVFQHPQPALLYLVPFCLVGLFLPAFIRGEIAEVLTYTEEEPAATEEKTEENAAKKSSTEKKQD